MLIKEEYTHTHTHTHTQMFNLPGICDRLCVHTHAHTRWSAHQSRTRSLTHSPLALSSHPAWTVAHMNTEAHINTEAHTPTTPTRASFHTNSSASEFHACPLSIFFPPQVVTQYCVKTPVFSKHAAYPPPSRSIRGL